MPLSTLGAAHFTSALAALALGALVLLENKGTPSHRAMGAGYVTAMILVNLTALGIYRLTGRFGPFHALALLSFATVVWGMRAVLQRRQGWLLTHFYCMAWSYVGLLAATAAEVIVRVPLLAASIDSAARAMAVGVAIAVVFAVLGSAIMPRLQRRAFASIERTGSPGAAP
jgi:uncharacterized membrane protein